MSKELKKKNVIKRTTTVIDILERSVGYLGNNIVKIQHLEADLKALAPYRSTSVELYSDLTHLIKTNMNSLNIMKRHLKTLCEELNNRN